RRVAAGRRQPDESVVAAVQYRKDALPGVGVLRLVVIVTGARIAGTRRPFPFRLARQGAALPACIGKRVLMRHLDDRIVLAARDRTRRSRRMAQAEPALQRKARQWQPAPPPQASLRVSLLLRRLAAIGDVQERKRH